MRCPKTPKTKFWVLEVGDDPGDETCKGPFYSFSKAFKSADSSYTDRFYYEGFTPTVHRNFIGFHRQISSLYIVWGLKSKPTYEKFIRPALMKERY